MTYTLKQLAEKTGKKTKDLAIYRGRKQLMYGEEGLVDMTEEVNIAFLQKYSLKDFEDPETETKPRKKVSKKVETEDRPGSEFEIVGDSEEQEIRDEEDAMRKYQESERALKHFQAKKAEFEQELKSLELAKRKGELIPTLLVGGLVAQLSKSLSATFRQAAEKLTDLLIVKYKLTPADAASMRKNLVDVVNKSVEDGVADTKRRIKSIASENSGVLE